MKSTLSSCSGYGKYFANGQDSTGKLKCFTLKQQFSHQTPFSSCKFDTAGQKIFLLDSSGELLCISLTDSSFSTIKQHHINAFAIDGSNSYNLLLINNKSELLQANIQRNSSRKIMNLNMSRILAFERNYLREMILVLDYKLLFLCDLADKSKIRSLKAATNQIFTNACFASQNRYLVLVVKNIQVRLVQVFNLKVIHQLNLPFEVKDLKIEVSYDCKTIAIYGNCNVIFFLRVEHDLTLWYELVELPFLKAVKLLKFSYENEILLLGNDQSIYAIADDDRTEIVPIFNADEHIRLAGFDVSLNGKQMVVVSNRTVFTIFWKSGIRGAMRESSSFKSISLKKSSQSQTLHNPSDQQYDDEKQDSNDEQLQAVSTVKCPVNKNRTRLIDFSTNKLINIPQIADKLKEPIHTEIDELLVQSVRKCHVQQIYKYLFETIENNKLLQKYKRQAVVTISVVLQLAKGNPYKTTEICFELFTQIINSAQEEEIQKFGLIFGSEIVQQVNRKSTQSFVTFFIRSLLSLFSNCLSNQCLIEIINVLLEQAQRTDFILLYFINVLKELNRDDPNWLNKQSNSVNLSIPFMNTIQILTCDKYTYAFAKLTHESEEHKNSRQLRQLEDKDTQTLTELITKQERLKKAIADIRKPI